MCSSPSTRLSCARKWRSSSIFLRSRKRSKARPNNSARCSMATLQRKPNRLPPKKKLRAPRRARPDPTLQANAERLRAKQELRRAEQREAVIIQSLPMVLSLEPYEANPRLPNFISGDFEAITGFAYDEVVRTPGIWSERLHAD